MPSWQNSITSLYMRIMLKRRFDDDHKQLTFFRKNIGGSKLVYRPVPRHLTVTPFNEEGMTGEWIISNCQTDKVILYLHGGGYISCSPQTHRPLTFALATQTNARVLALDYRLMPENKAPVALDDALHCYKWLLKQHIPANKIAVMGDSAGGGLTLRLLIALREEGIAQPAAGICFSPWTDLAITGASIKGNEKTDSIFYAETISRVANICLGGLSGKDPSISPLYADLKSLPPLMILVSNSEILLDDSLRVAEKATKAGVDVKLMVESGLPHVWPVFDFLPEAKKSVIEVSKFLDQCWSQKVYQ